MNYPDYYDKVPVIKLYDPLSDFLGAINDGIVQFRYIDAVKFAGHSCPTVAGAYLMTLVAIDYFSKNNVPAERGNIKIVAKGSKTEGTNGVIANVAAYICGVNDESGFAGIGGNMSRKNKLFYDSSLDCDLKFEYKGSSIKLTYNPLSIKVDERMFPLLQKSIKGLASDDEQKLFKKLWQDRVKAILLNPDEYDEIIFKEYN